MKVKVTKQDINRGRKDAGVTCGCPIWHALNRTLGLHLTVVSKDLLEIPEMHVARVKSADYPIKIVLPEKAVELQQLLRAVPNAPVKPFTFDATLEFAGKK